MALAEDASSYSIKAILSKTYTSGDKKLYVEEKNFDKIAEILHKNLSIDKKDALNILEDGAKKELYQVEFGSYGKNISQETKQNIEADMKKKVSLVFILSTIRLGCIKWRLFFSFYWIRSSRQR